MNTIQTDIHLLLTTGTPSFANDRLLRFDADIEGASSTYQRGSVDLAKVVGTTHGDYAGSTWLALLPSRPEDFSDLEYFERFNHQGLLSRGWNSINDLRRNPGYYLSQTEKEHWSFAKIGDHYYVTEGNHRTVIGRFFLSLNNLSTVVHGVSITEYHLPDVVDEGPKGLGRMFSKLFNNFSKVRREKA